MTLALEINPIISQLAVSTPSRFGIKPHPFSISFPNKVSMFFRSSRLGSNRKILRYGPSPPTGSCVLTGLEHRTFPGDRLVRGGGVALVFRAAFHYRKLDFDLNPRTFEFLAVMLTLGGVRTLVVTIYRPDGRNNAFYGEFESLLEMIAVFNCNFIILGDVNIHLDVTTDPATKKFSSIVDSFGLRQMVETATHRAGHTLDIVLVGSDRSDGV